MRSWRLLQLLGALLIFPVDACVGAHEGVLGHVGRIATGWRGAAEGFGHGPDVMRACATADAEIPDADLSRLAREVGDLEAIAGEGVHRDREGPAIGEGVVTRVLERLEGRLLVMRAVRHGQ